MTPDLTRFLIVMAMAFVLAPALLLTPSAAFAAQQITLRDGDSFVLDGEEFRLWGIDAPEFFQTCRDQNGQNYSCGREAKDFLQDLIAARAVRCEKMPRREGEARTVARCFAGEDDLGRMMVRGGWAVEYKYFSKGFYTADELQAKKNRRGLWAGTFTNPRDWRKLNAKRQNLR